MFGAAINVVNIVFHISATFQDKIIKSSLAVISRLTAVFTLSIHSISMGFFFSIPTVPGLSRPLLL